MKFVRFPIFVDDVEIRRLGEAEISDALRLLHNVYVNETGWLPPFPNKSGLHIREDKEGCFLYDSLVSEAVWFGAIYNGRVIGCFRVIVYPLSELKYYRDLPEIISCTPASELNRLAIHKEWRRHQKIMLTLLRAAFDYAFLITPVVYTTAKIGKYSKLYRRLGLLPCNSFFKYDEKDSEPVDILYFDMTSACRHKTFLYKSTDHLALGSREATMQQLQ